MKKSKLLQLNKFDFLKGLIVAFISAFLTGLYTSLESGKLPSTQSEWKSILAFGLVAAVSYLLKNLFTPEPKNVNSKAS